MDYYIGIDIGTTSTKIVAFSIMGEVLAQQSNHYKITHPQIDRSEQDPNKILTAVMDGLQFIVNKLPKHNPVLASFSAAMHSLILINKDGELLTDCIIWADNRASKIADDLKQTVIAKNFYHLSGVPIHAMSPFCKLYWFKENEPSLFYSASKFIGIKEFIFYQLFNQFIIDTGIASATGFLNSSTLKWEQQMLDYTHIKEDQLSTLVNTKHIAYLPVDTLNKYAFLLAFKNTAFVIGSNDGGLANLGSGATIEGSMAVTIGTSGAVRIVTDRPITDTELRTFCYHLTGQQYILGGASNNGAVVIQWLKENILQNNNSYNQFLKMAETIAAGSNGLLFLPYILGERAPIWNSNAKALFFGLDASHTNAHLVRSAMEAIIYNMYAIGKILMDKKKVNIIYANGGFADNIFWIQLLSDMFNLPVFVPIIEESSALGAVLIGLEALNINSRIDQSKGKYYYPNLTEHKIYMEQFIKWQRLYELIKIEF